MRVDVNGAEIELAAGLTLVQLIEQQAGSTRGSAVVVDDEVVPRREWPGYELREGQRIELITAVPGG